MSELMYSHECLKKYIISIKDLCIPVLISIDFDDFTSVFSLYLMDCLRR